MKARTLAVGFFAFAALFAFCLPARATTYDLTLSGIVADAGSGSGPGYVNGYLSLSSVSLPITVSQGDIIDATVTLDTPYTIPASGTSTSFVFYLEGSSFPTESTESQGTISFSDGGTPGLNSGPQTSFTGNQLALAFVFPTTASITFDSFTADLTVTGLGEPATLDGASFAYYAFSPSAPVPEPDVVWFLGSGLIGLIGLRRRFKR